MRSKNHYFDTYSTFTSSCMGKDYVEEVFFERPPSFVNTKLFTVPKDIKIWNKHSVFQLFLFCRSSNYCTQMNTIELGKKQCLNGITLFLCSYMPYAKGHVTAKICSLEALSTRLQSGYWKPAKNVSQGIEIDDLQ